MKYVCHGNEIDVGDFHFSSTPWSSSSFYFQRCKFFFRSQNTIETNKYFLDLTTASAFSHSLEELCCCHGSIFITMKSRSSCLNKITLQKLRSEGCRSSSIRKKKMLLIHGMGKARRKDGR